MSNRKPIALPTYNIDRYLGGIHVMTPDADVEARVRTVFSEDRCREYCEDNGYTVRSVPGLIKRAVAYALKTHRANREVYLGIYPWRR